MTSCVLAGAAALVAYYGLGAKTWAVMTEELQVARLATSIAERHVELVSNVATRLADGRAVALHLERLTVSRSWPCAAL